MPNLDHGWEAQAAFNPTVIVDGKDHHLLFRALSFKQKIDGNDVELSTIGYAHSEDGFHFGEHRQLIVPSEPWDRYGCEDPRVTKWGDDFYIFYTAIGGWPAGPSNIRVAVAKTRDFKTITEKHLVTPFNAKAMALFPEKVHGKLAVIFAAHTDEPPAYICMAYLDRVEELWDPSFWEAWHKNITHHTLPLWKGPLDLLEVGAVPVKTSAGWLLNYCHIQNYFAPQKIFRIDMALLDMDDPLVVLGQTSDPLLIPEREYETRGMIPNIIFPSGCTIVGDEVRIYYGGCDTVSCVATTKLTDLIEELRPNELTRISLLPRHITFERASANPIIAPRSGVGWEAAYTLNPGAVYVGGKVHIFYRAQGNDGVSVLGYATSKDGIHIDERYDQPVYVPRMYFEKKASGAGFSGCEDARITQMGDVCNMAYTAYDGVNPPRVAVTSIHTKDLERGKFAWDIPRLLSPPGIDDKNSCVLPEKVNGKYVIMHRLSPHLWVDYVDSLEFAPHQWLGGRVTLEPRPNSWDSEKVGIGPAPFHTDIGWVLIYHSISRHDRRYRLGAALLDHTDLTRVRVRLQYPVLEPKESYEMSGLRPGTVFACGHAVIGERLYVYYGGADQFTCVASLKLADLLKELSEHDK